MRETTNRRWQTKNQRYGGGGWTSFTSKPSPKFCYKVDVSSAILGEVRLSYPHEAKDQWVIEDVAGDNTLWNERNLKVAWFVPHTWQVKDIGHKKCKPLTPIWTWTCILFGSELWYWCITSISGIKHSVIVKVWSYVLAASHKEVVYENATWCGGCNSKSKKIL